MFNNFSHASDYFFYRMGATVFVQPLDLVKTRLQISGQGGSAKEYTGMFDVRLYLNVKNNSNNFLNILGIYKNCKT